jgi:hypothetical protein
MEIKPDSSDGKILEKTYRSVFPLTIVVQKQCRRTKKKDSYKFDTVRQEAVNMMNVTTISEVAEIWKIDIRVKICNSN